MLIFAVCSSNWAGFTVGVGSEPHRIKFANSNWNPCPGAFGNCQFMHSARNHYQPEPADGASQFPRYGSQTVPRLLRNEDYAHSESRPRIAASVSEFME